MPIITEIKPLHANCFRVTCDDESIHKIHRKYIEKHNISKSDNIEDILFSEIVFLSNVDFAKYRAVYFLSLRDHSRSQLFKKLVPFFPQECCDTALDILMDQGLLDDEKFAINKSESLINHKNYDLSRVKSELINCGISSEIIDSTLEIVRTKFMYDSRTAACELVAKKYYHKLSDEASVKRTYNTLMRLGFSYDDTRFAVNHNLELIEKENDESNFAGETG